MKYILARGGVELIAVVLGITMPFWIESKKNKRSELREQISLLENLQTSLEQDLSYALNIEKALDTCLTSQKYLINLDCSNIATLKNSSFTKHIFNSTKGGWSFFPRYGVYRALSQNNDLGLIDNDTLKSRLITLYDFIYKRYENIDIVMENHYQYNYPKFLIDNFYGGLKKTDVKKSEEIPIKYKINKKKICDGSLRSEILHINGITGSAYKSVSKIIEEVKEISEIIDSELTKLVN